MSEKLQELNLGFVPELAVPGPILMAADEQAIFSFNVSAPAGMRAIIKVPWMYRLRFGGPAGESLDFAFVEVRDSSWLNSVFTEHPYLCDRGLRHFRVAFHDSSLEFLAPEFQHELRPFSSEILNDMVQWVKHYH
jgi:hypothetical protein